MISIGYTEIKSITHQGLKSVSFKNKLYTKYLLKKIILLKRSSNRMYKSRFTIQSYVHVNLSYTH